MTGDEVDMNGMDDIRKAIMPLPYKTAHMGPLMQLVENMVETGQRVGGTATTMVGEGKADVPVGTMLAMIEQATKTLNAVHKRLHTSQAEEFRLLMDVFRDHPDVVEFTTENLIVKATYRQLPTYYGPSIVEMLRNGAFYGTEGV